MSAARIIAIFVAAGLAGLLSAQTLPQVSVSVHTESGVALQGAIVDVQRNGQSTARVASAADGKIAIPGLPAGEYKVSISLEGFEPSQQTITVGDERQQIDIDVTLISKLRHADSVDVLADAESLEVQTTTPVAA